MEIDGHLSPPSLCVLLRKGEFAGHAHLSLCESILDSAAAADGRRHRDVTSGGNEVTSPTRDSARLPPQKPRIMYEMDKYSINVSVWLAGFQNTLSLFLLCVGGGGEGEGGIIKNLRSTVKIASVLPTFKCRPFFLNALIYVNIFRNAFFLSST